MTDFVIKDGTGTGRVGRVNVRNQLDVIASTQSEEHKIALSTGLAFFASTAETANSLTLATGNTYNVMYLKNTNPTKVMVIEKILSSSDTAGINMQWVRNPTLGTIANQNTMTPDNTNFGSATTPTGTFYVWDESGTTGLGGLSGGTTVKTFITGVGFTVHPIDGAMILPAGTALLIKATNATGGNVEWECGVRFYYQDEDD